MADREGELETLFENTVSKAVLNESVFFYLIGIDHFAGDEIVISPPLILPWDFNPCNNRKNIKY